MAIIGMHALIYTGRDAETRAMFRDVLGLRGVDAGHGWLIFEAPPAELAVHPAEGEARHELYLMCDDIVRTVADLRKKGVDTRPIQERPWGRLAEIVLPDGTGLGMYEPRHPTAIGGRKASGKKPRAKRAARPGPSRGRRAPRHA